VIGGSGETWKGIERDPSPPPESILTSNDQFAGSSLVRGVYLCSTNARTACEFFIGPCSKEMLWQIRSSCR
jgi:hypothetical protein